MIHDMNTSSLAEVYTAVGNMLLLPHQVLGETRKDVGAQCRHNMRPSKLSSKLSQ